jgi:hypothetical protein
MVTRLASTLGTCHGGFGNGRVVRGPHCNTQLLGAGSFSTSVGLFIELRSRHEPKM